MIRARAWIFLTSVLFGGFLEAAEADAAPTATPSRSQTVVLMVDPAMADPLVSRIEAELLSVGLAVRRIDVSPDVDIETVVSRAMASGASAALRIIPRSRGTEVWTSDTRARVLRRRSINLDPSDPALSVLAFRSVEFLRASLLDVPKSVIRAPAEPEKRHVEPRRPVAVPIRPDPPPEENPPRAANVPSPTPLVVTELTDAPRSPPFTRGPASFDALVGAALWLGSRQLAALPTLALALRYRITRAVSVGPEALIPLSTQTMTAPEGSSAIRLIWVALSAQRTQPMSARLDLQARGSVGVIQLRADGNDPVHGLGRAEVTWATAAGVSVGAAMAVTCWLSARLDAGGGFASKRIVIAFAGRDVATWGPAFAVVGAALEASF